ncbi:hypothetical protein FRC20_008277 [Serendipita sp. 405]|nr:hypothetical protein FRC15_002330 [Serendipita sp. 397]KAG8830812.1 hypothetical protein FRC20_008277 [Serendipita sp. 405]
MSTDKAGVICYNCDEPGHYANECPKKKNEVQAKAVRLEAEESDERSEDESSAESVYDWDAIIENGRDDSSGREDKGPSLRVAAMRIERLAYARKAFAKERKREEVVKTNIVKQKEPTTDGQPSRNPEHQRCIKMMVTINGLDAKALINPGSNTDMVTPDFAKVAKLEIIELVEPIALQLALTGSRSRKRDIWT